MTPYKALMIDFDGTAIPNSPDGMPSDKVLNAITKAQEIMPVCAVTSRPLAVALPVITKLQLSSVCVIDGGAQIFDPVSQKMLWEKPIEKKDVKTVLEFAEKRNLLVKHSDGSLQRPTGLPDPTQDIFDIIYIKLTNEQADEYIHELSSIPTLSVHKVVSWDIGTLVLKMSHAEATKQHGILKLSELLHIDPHDMIGVGDGYNDYPLLMSCGLKVAMGNAVPELKAIADFIAPSVEEDGMVAVIEKFVLQ